MRWVGHVECKEAIINVKKSLVGRPEMKQSFGRPRRRWKYNIKIDLKQARWYGMKWISLPQVRDT
jgi:hypothetical protein